jgi:hypothetical protein
MTSEYVQLLFEEFLKPSEAGCSSGQERSRLSDRQIETLNEGGIECIRIFRIQECLFEIPFVPNDHSAIYLGGAIIPASLDHLSIQAFTEVVVPGNSSRLCLCDFSRVMMMQPANFW